MKIARKFYNFIEKKILHDSHLGTFEKFSEWLFSRAPANGCFCNIADIYLIMEARNRSGVLIVKFEQTSYIALVFLPLTLNPLIPVKIEILGFNFNAEKLPKNRHNTTNTTNTSIRDIISSMISSVA